MLPGLNCYNLVHQAFPDPAGLKTQVCFVTVFPTISVIFQIQKLRDIQVHRVRCWNNSPTGTSDCEMMLWQAYWDLNLNIALE